MNKIYIFIYLVVEANLTFHLWAEGFAQTNLNFAYFASYGAAFALGKNFPVKWINICWIRTSMENHV